MNSDGNSLLFSSLLWRGREIEESSQYPQCMIKYYHITISLHLPRALCSEKKNPFLVSSFHGNTG